MIQKGQFRKTHLDFHFCVALFCYMRDYAIKFRDISVFACIDDKYFMKVGEPVFPIATAERGREAVVSTNEVFVVGDHDFTKFKIPSVILLVDIPETIDGSIYSGKVFVGLKDKIFETSSPLCHAIELYESMMGITFYLYILMVVLIII
uniref:Uncharacterized protein n=1 Tax=Amphimedon queenslandica TaxID=400682 RepID=A0A1X7VKZ4_AMPQE